MDKKEAKWMVSKIIKEITLAFQMENQENWIKTQLLVLDKRKENQEVLSKKMQNDLVTI